MPKHHQHLTPEEKSFLHRLRLWSERLAEIKADRPETVLGKEQQAYSINKVEREILREVANGCTH
jgi:cytochrome c-type biogenesis protein CcmH/NrfG